MKAKRFFALLLSLVMVLGVMPMTVFSYWEEPSAEGNIDLETTVYDYTKPVGVTMQRLTGNCVAEFGEDGNLGDDFLFVINSYSAKATSVFLRKHAVSGLFVLWR